MDRRERGFSYVISMLLVAVVSVVSMRGFQITLTKEMREKEAQLLEVGLAYQLAIQSYYEGSPGTSKTFPPSLDALLLDERTTTVRRHLRRLYRDPITASTEWGQLRNADGGIIGVFSLSERRPIKVADFPKGVVGALDGKKYQDWKFVYQPI